MMKYSSLLQDTGSKKKLNDSTHLKSGNFGFQVGQFYLTINKNMAESLGITTVSITKAHGRNLDKGKGVGEKSLVVRDY